MPASCSSTPLCPPGPHANLNPMLATPQWFHSDATHLGASNLISASIAKAEQRHPGIIPDLRQNPTLLLGSDYGGLHKTADFAVITLLRHERTVRQIGKGGSRFGLSPSSESRSVREETLGC